MPLQRITCLSAFKPLVAYIHQRMMQHLLAKRTGTYLSLFGFIHFKAFNSSLAASPPIMGTEKILICMVLKLYRRPSVAVVKCKSATKVAGNAVRAI
jgi:uncharacterized protein YneF (UPF0154 family)